MKEVVEDDEEEKVVCPGAKRGKHSSLCLGINEEMGGEAGRTMM